MCCTDTSFCSILQQTVSIFQREALVGPPTLVSLYSLNFCSSSIQNLWRQPEKGCYMLVYLPTVLLGQYWRLFWMDEKITLCPKRGRLDPGLISNYFTMGWLSAWVNWVLYLAWVIFVMLLFWAISLWRRCNKYWRGQLGLESKWVLFFRHGVGSFARSNKIWVRFEIHTPQGIKTYS